MRNSVEPREALKSFKSSDLCLLVKNFYTQDFTDYDKYVLEKEFYYFEHNVGEGISIHYMDVYLNIFFFAYLRLPQLEILGPSLLTGD